MQLKTSHVPLMLIGFQDLHAALSFSLILTDAAVFTFSLFSPRLVAESCSRPSAALAVVKRGRSRGCKWETRRVATLNHTWQPLSYSFAITTLLGCIQKIPKRAFHIIVNIMKKCHPLSLLIVLEVAGTTQEHTTPWVDDVVSHITVRQTCCQKKNSSIFIVMAKYCGIIQGWRPQGGWVMK